MTQTGRITPESLLPPEPVEVAPPRILSRGEKITQFLQAMNDKSPLKKLFVTPPITEDEVDEVAETARTGGAIKKLTFQAVLIGIFACLLALGAPFFKPLYVYHSVTPEGRSALLVPLDLPNLTNPAVVSWSATSVTEVLSFGFGDVEAKTILQKKRFTPAGWKAFVKAFLSTKVSDTFKRNQMVMTTVPSDTPVVLSQGINDDDVYQWKVEVPIITTYAANNNVIKPEHGTILMTLVRVAYEVNPTGIAIDVWKQKKH